LSIVLTTEIRLNAFRPAYIIIPHPSLDNCALTSLLREEFQQLINIVAALFTLNISNQVTLPKNEVVRLAQPLPFLYCE
jgi:hypothetical protein